METAFLVFVCFQSLFSLVCGLTIYDLHKKLKRQQKKDKNTFKTLCAIGNDMTGNFHKVFTYIEHQLTKEQKDQGFPGAQM